MKRLFIAIKVHPDRGFLEQFRDLKNDLRHENIKWVEENNIHITLKFLGETEENFIPEINVVLDETGRKASPFIFSLEKTGIFGSKYAPRVVWAGIEPYEEMKNLMQNVHKSLKIVGFEPDRQNLVPHLTLGRIKILNDKRNFQNIIDQYKDLKSEKFIVKEFHLFESILRREGPQYSILSTYTLKKT